MHLQPMGPDHGTQYEENPSNHHGGMRKDGRTDITLFTGYRQAISWQLFGNWMAIYWLTIWADHMLAMSPNQYT